MEASQEFDQVSEDVSTILRIPRSANKLGKNGDIGRIDNQSITGIENSPVFKEEYACYISDLDTLDLTVSSIFILSNSFILKRPFKTIYIILLK